MANKTKIKSDSKLIQFCNEILIDYLDENARFVPDVNSNTEKSYHLSPTSGNWNVRQNAHGISIPVVKLQSEFFLSCSVSFKSYGQKIEFKSISLQFFDMKKLLFRAEWDNWEIKQEEEKDKEEDIKQHPQPHWHLGDSSEVGVTEKVADTFQTYIQNSSYKQFELKLREREKRDLNKLHFFMKMEEGASQPTYFDLTYESDFKEWLRETMRSVNQELGCLSK